MSKQSIAEEAAVFHRKMMAWLRDYRKLWDKEYARVGNADDFTYDGDELKRHQADR